MFLFLISLYLRYVLVNSDVNRPPLYIPQSDSLSPIQMSNTYPRRQASPQHPGRPFRPLHSFYIGLNPSKTFQLSNQNIHHQNPGPFSGEIPYSSPTDMSPTVQDPLLDVNTEHVLWPHETSPTPPTDPETLEPEPIDYTIEQYPDNQATEDQMINPSTETTTDTTTTTTEPTITTTEPTIATIDYMAPTFYIKTSTTYLVPLGTSNATENVAQLFQVDEQGFHYVVIPKKVETTTVYIPPSPEEDMWTPTTAGAVLYGHFTSPKTTLSPKKQYLDMMDELHEGYMMIFILEFAKLLSLKNDQDIKDVLVHTEIIYNRLRDNGRLVWLKDPLQAVVWKVAMILSNVRHMETIRTYASMMYHMLMQRKTEISDEVNTIIDEADLFYNDEEGDRLFSSLIEFENYPNKTSKTGYFLCHSFIASILKPFSRLSGSGRRQRLLDRINIALRKRFPQLCKRNKNNTLLYGETSINGTEPKRKPYQTTEERNRNKIVRLQHKLYKLGYTNESIYVRHYSISLKNSMLRTMTNMQARFRATTGPSTQAIIPTSPYISNSVTQSTTDSVEESIGELSYEETTPVELIDENDSLNTNDEGTFQVSSANDSEILSSQ